MCQMHECKSVNAELWNIVHTVTPKKLIFSMASRIISLISWSVTVKLRWMLYLSLYFTVSMTLVKTLAITHVPSYAKPWNLLAPICINCCLLSYSLSYSSGVWAEKNRDTIKIIRYNAFKWLCMEMWTITTSTLQMLAFLTGIIYDQTDSC